MGIYRKVYQPFGTVWDPGDVSQIVRGEPYQLDWPGIVGTAERLGIAANQIATGAQPLAPGAGVTAPGAAEAPTGLQAPPAGTPGVSAGTSPWLLIGGAAAIYYFILK
jgi:hypothetical protein